MVSSNRYLDIDSILMEQELVPCSFIKDVNGMGYLDSSTRNVDLAEGTKLDLPIWLAGTLKVSKFNPPSQCRETRLWS